MSDTKPLLVVKCSVPLGDCGLKNAERFTAELGAAMDMPSVFMPDGFDLSVESDLAPLIDEQRKTNELLQKLIDCQPKHALSTFDFQHISGVPESALAEDVSRLLSKVNPDGVKGENTL